MLFETFTYEHLNDSQFLKEFQSLKVKEQFLKIELLDFNENPIQEIQGKCITGTLSIDGASSMRRTCSFSMLADEETYDITNIDNILSLNKKFKLYIGYTNSLSEYSHYGEKIWFPLGVFVMTTSSINNSANGGNISINGKDKMCLLNGEVGGTLPAPVVLHEKYIRNADGSTTVKPSLLYDIIRESVIEFGGQDPGKIMINDVPINGKKVLRYMGNKTLYYDINNNEVAEGQSYYRKVEPGELAGYDYVPFRYPGELIKQAGEPVTSILDSVKNVLGNFEYYYDVHGNFIFQEIKNYLNTSYTPITHLEGGNYEVNFGEGHLAHSFKDSDIIISYSNSPNYQNIKNDFIVWGSRKTAAGAEVPIRYHVAIDDIPQVPESYGNIPWQVYLYKYGEQAQAQARDAGYYYRELANEIPKIYDLENNQWKNIDSASMDYYLDFIDTNSELGKFSIKTIGRRTKAVTDKDVTMLYRPPTPDHIILEMLPSTATQQEIKERQEYIDHLNSIGQSFLVVSQRDLYEYAAVGKDAFSVIRDLIFQHTSYNESINISAMPMYYLEPNTRIEVEDSRSNIYGEYIIRNISLPLSHEGAMSISAVRATNRL
ncbi:MAG: hypothetical protein J6A25_02600 [Lachnospiraceae bacterium]|nr:hypothetical protein [Lachnospiraceae bacterium]